MRGNLFSKLVKRLTPFLLPAALCLSAFAQQTPVPVLTYKFTVGAGYTLSNVFLIDTIPAELYATITSISTNGQSFGPGSRIGGHIPGTTYGISYLTLIAVFITATNTGVAMSLPPALAANLIPNASWDSFNNSTNFPFQRLPDEPTTLFDLQTESANTLEYSWVYSCFSYLQATNPVLLGSGLSSPIVAFDGAQSAGSFFFVPQPALSIASGGAGVTIQWPSNASDFTLAQSTNLSLGPWSNVTNVPAIIGTNLSVTLPAGAAHCFFRLRDP